ncbi:MAG: hypothetical protein DDT35_01296 [Firmicutes bacterium]|nr:hypothetical protein [Bacillota bacterium]
MGDFRDDIGRGRSDEQQRGALGQGDVFYRHSGMQREHCCYHGAVRDSLQGQGVDELLRGSGHHYIDI